MVNRICFCIICKGMFKKRSLSVNNRRIGGCHCSWLRNLTINEEAQWHPLERPKWTSNIYCMQLLFTLSSGATFCLPCAAMRPCSKTRGDFLVCRPSHVRNRNTDRDTGVYLDYRRPNFWVLSASLFFLFGGGGRGRGGLLDWFSTSAVKLRRNVACEALAVILSVFRENQRSLDLGLCNDFLPAERTWAFQHV